MTAAGMVSFVLAAVLYGAATAIFYMEVARGRASTSPRAPVLLALGAAAHVVYVVVASFVAHACPVHSSHFFLSIASLVATGVYLLARRRFRIHALGLVVAPVGLLVALSTFFMGAAEPGTKLPASFIGFHVFANLCGVALFLLASGAAGMYLVQERQLQRKQGILSRALPPLDVLDRAVHRFLVAGFPLLTLGLASGTVWAAQVERVGTDGVLRTLFGWAMWVLLGGVLLLRVVAGWRGRRAAYGTVAGFACAVVVLVLYAIRPWLRTVGG